MRAALALVVALTSFAYIMPEKNRQPLPTIEVKATPPPPSVSTSLLARAS